MRVAFLNRRRDSYPGGDLVRIDSTIEALKRYGVEGVYAPEGWTIDWLKSFDLVHISHINFGWSKYNLERTYEAGVPYVITPVFYPTMDMGMNVQDMEKALSEAKAIFPQSSQEYNEILDNIPGSYTNKVLLVPNGTDTSLFYPDIVTDKTYVACVVSRLGEKNESVVEEQCKLLSIPYQLITGYDRTRLASVLRESVRVFVNLSDSDRMSLTIGEALCSGCRVIATDQNRGNEWYGQGLVTIQCNPVNKTKVRGAIAEAYWAKDSEWDYSPNTMARNFTWDKIARILSEVYKDVIK